MFGYEYNDGGRSKYYKGKAGDCVCRAIAIVTGLDYKEVFDDLKYYTGQNPNRGIKSHSKGLRQYMSLLGFRYGIAPPATTLCEGKLPSKGKLVCIDKSHAIAVIDGVVYDSFDSRFKYKKPRVIVGYFIN